MHEQGFDYWPVPAAPITAAERFPYVIDNDKWANENGFGPSDSAVADDKNTSPIGRYLGTLTPGDWDGDGKDNIGVRMGNVFAFRTSPVTADTETTASVAYGNGTGEIPIVGDWNGDGTDTQGVVG